MPSIFESASIHDGHVSAVLGGNEVHRDEVAGELSVVDERRPGPLRSARTVLSDMLLTQDEATVRRRRNRVGVNQRDTAWACTVAGGRGIGGSLIAVLNVTHFCDTEGVSTPSTT